MKEIVRNIVFRSLAACRWSYVSSICLILLKLNSSRPRSSVLLANRTWLTVKCGHAGAIVAAGKLQGKSAGM